METPENSEADEEEIFKDAFGGQDSKQLNSCDQKEINSMISSKETEYIQNISKSGIGDKIMTEYLSGNWQNFFDIWSKSIPLNVQDSIEYKSMTLMLRVHFAILPIRIVELHQNVNCVSHESSKVFEILHNVADKFSSVDDEKDSEDDKSKLTVDSMKQLEDFLNSCDGQNLTEELKYSSFMTFFALPYIVNPHEDDSMKKIFSIDWLEKLTLDLEKFIEKHIQEEFPLEEKIEVIEYHSSSNIKKSRKFSTIRTLPRINSSRSDITNDRKSKLNESNNDILCDRIVDSAIKNKQIEDWIARHHQSNEEDSLCIKSTQTRISSIKTGAGFSLIAEPHHIASVVTPNTFTKPNKQSTIYNDELNVTKSRLFNMHKHYKKLKLRFHKLHEDYQKMNEIAEELTIALENSVQGLPVNLDTILQSCVKIFPDRFNRVIQTDSEDTCIESKDDLHKSIISTKEKRSILNNIPVPPKLLDYKKIKLHLKNGNVKTKLLLLQALRQKLTLNQPNHRDESMLEYINKDLLGLQGNILNNNDDNILSIILQPNNVDISGNYIQQSTSRFINALGSLSVGRTYLTSGPVVLNAIVKYLDSCNNGAGDAITLDMLLATLQKMSLRKQQRNYMIEANLVEWLIYHLNNENFRMGSYRLEYTCALLMNLSLQSVARIRASVIASLFVITMTNLLSSDCTSILPYVNGALQNFLLNDEINEEAKKLHLEEILEYHSRESDVELRNLFSHTLRIHKREYTGNLLDDDEFSDEDDEIFDVLENELEEEDPVRVKAGELQGEFLLALCYTVPSYFSRIKNYSHKKPVEVSRNQIDDFTARESKKAGLTASTIIAKSEITFDDSKTEKPEKKSGTAVAYPPKKITSSNKEKLGKSLDEEEEDAFQAKPKLMRTPPSSARNGSNTEKITRRALSKSK